MSARSRTGALLALLVTASVLSAGIAGVALADSPSTADEQSTTESTPTDGAAVVENVTERIETLETVSFTRTTESEFDDRTTNATSRVVANLGTHQLRTETIASSYGGNATTVLNETHMRTYYPEDNTVNTVEYDSTGTSVLPQLTQLANASAVEYEYLGTGTVAGEDVYRLDVSSQRTLSDTNTSMTLAVDAETYFPVQVVTEIRGEQLDITATRTYSNVSINEELPDDTFELDVPEDATEPSFEGPDVTSYDEHSTLQSDAELSVPPADLPGEFEFDSAQTIDGDGYYSVSLTYTNGDERAQLSVQKESPFDWGERDGYEEVTVGDETGHYTEHDEYAFLHVSGDDQSYNVYGKLDKDNIVDIAAAALDS